VAGRIRIASQSVGRIGSRRKGTAHLQQPCREATFHTADRQFNSLNTLAFNASPAVAGLPTFGTIVPALDPRVMPLDTKFLL
jgi:hypothetical protein